ncbi:MAG: DUF2752 domain-containing protein [Bacteroidales bacterium]|nr:DUF2752 domain-containing protein [Bacteroidales bacterium]
MIKNVFTSLRLRRVAMVGALAAAIATLYYIFDPVESRWAPRCIVRSLTGLDCPGCGSQRMIHALLHGDFRSAWDANPFLLCVSPLILAWLWIEADPSTYPRMSRALNSPGFIGGVLMTLIVWTILRNILL